MNTTVKKIADRKPVSKTVSKDEVASRYADATNAAKRAKNSNRTAAMPKPGQRDVIVISNKAHTLTYTDHAGQVHAFKVAVGTPSNQWTTGQAPTSVHSKKANPSWTPTPNMRRKNRNARAIAGGASNNPFGKYALYLHGFYRIHGTNVPSSVGKSASHGCFRMAANDIKYLYQTVRTGTQVYVVNAPYRPVA